MSLSNMLEKLHRLAFRLEGLKPVVIAAIVGFVALIVFALVDGREHRGLLILSVIATIWTMLLLALIEMFRSLPPAPTTQDGFFRRLKLRLKHGFFALLALLTALVTVLLIGLTFKLLTQL
ncbi:MAG: hypothetical protein RQ899_09285 [Pseudomonadales bacterium]|nr:hypothetical protein [Pseudomonadales bacterium]